MTKSDLLEIVKQQVLEILPELEGTEIPTDESLVDLGLNSIDRGELIMLTLEEIELEVPRVAFAGASTINELVDLLFEKSNA